MKDRKFPRDDVVVGKKFKGMDCGTSIGKVYIPFKFSLDIHVCLRLEDGGINDLLWRHVNGRMKRTKTQQLNYLFLIDSFLF